MPLIIVENLLQKYLIFSEKIRFYSVSYCWFAKTCFMFHLLLFLCKLTKFYEIFLSLMQTCLANSPEKYCNKVLR